MRMRTKAVKLCSLLMICLAMSVAAREQNNQRQGSLTNATSVDDIRHYREMFRVNREPVDMIESTRVMCAPPNVVYGPHYDPGVVYYINEIARTGAANFKINKRFPVGSIIVKEKQERRTEDSVQIITVMKKVMPGSEEDSWEYTMYDTKKWKEIDGSRAGTNPATKACIGCHRRYLNNDYVSDKGMQLLLGK